MRSTAAHRCIVGALAAATVVIVPTGPVAAADDGPAFEVTADSGMRGHDSGTYLAVSRTTNNAFPAAVVAGTASKPSAVPGAAADRDVVLSAVDTSTGQLRWTTRRDGGTLTDDVTVGVEVDYNNNLVYVASDSDQDLRVQAFALRDGGFSNQAVYPAASASDLTMGGAGFYVAPVGQTAGNFLVAVYEWGGRTLLIDDHDEPGEALAVGHDRAYASQSVVVTTGTSSRVAGNGGDVYVVAHRYRSGSGQGVGQLWERRFAGPAGLVDKGVAVEVATSRTLGPVAFVAARSFSPATGWDTLVWGYRLLDGSPLWAGDDDGVRRFAGADDSSADADAVPAAVRFDAANERVWVAGHVERPTPHGDDVFLLGLDAATGEERALAIAGGRTSNGDDVATDVEVADDGSRVLVAATLADGGSGFATRAAVLGFMPDGEPAGQHLVGSKAATGERAGRLGLAYRARTTGTDKEFGVPRTRVITSATSDPGAVPPTGADQAAAGAELADFVPTPPPVVPDGRPLLLALGGAVIALLFVRRPDRWRGSHGLRAKSAS